MSSKQERIAKYGFWTSVITFITTVISKILDWFQPRMASRSSVVSDRVYAIQPESYASAAPAIDPTVLIIILSICGILFFWIWRKIVEKRKRNSI